MKSKTLLLLLVFLFRTLTGIACAWHGSKDKPSQEAVHSHHPLASRPEAITIISSQSSIDENDSCCQGVVHSFTFLDKLVPSSKQTIQLASAFYISSFFVISLVRLPRICVDFQHSKNEIRSAWINSRIAIGRFQI